MSHEYLRCPICGKLSRVKNFQIHDVEGHHRFPDVMVQEIYSIGRGKIRNKWHSAKLDWKTKQELNQVFKKILSQVLAGVLADLDEEVGLADEDELIQLVPEEVKKGKKKRKRKGKAFEVAGDEFDEMFTVRLESSDEFFQSGDEPEDEIEIQLEDEFFRCVDDESLNEETFKVF